MEYSGLMHVIQLPETTAPAEQEKLIIYQPYVPGNETRQQFEQQSKLPNILPHILQLMVMQVQQSKHRDYPHVF